MIDHFTSFNIIWPIEKKETEQVVHGLRTFVFSYYGQPSILHSDNGLEFKNGLVTNLVNTWPGTCKIVHGKPRCQWVQGKVEQSNGTMQTIKLFIIIQILHILQVINYYFNYRKLIS